MRIAVVGTGAVGGYFGGRLAEAGESVETASHSPSVVNSKSEITMSKTILAEYDAQHRTLKLEEPLEGIKDHERVAIAIADDRDLVSAAMVLSQESLSHVWDNADDAEYDRL